MKRIRSWVLYAVFMALIFSSCTAKNFTNTGNDEADTLRETSVYEPEEDAGDAGVLSEELYVDDSETEIVPEIETIIQTEIQSEIEPEPEFDSEHDSNTEPESDSEPESKTSRKVDIYYTKDNPYPERELLTSLPERGLYLYAYPIDGKTRIGNDGVSLWDDINIYLEIKDKLIWLKTDFKARPDYYLYYLSLFHGDEYLLFEDYIHGGHGGGETEITILDGKTYSKIPIEKSPYFNPNSNHEICDNNVIIALDGNHKFEIPIGEISMTYKFGNRFKFDDNRLIEYFYYHIPELDYKKAEIGNRFQVCFKVEYTYNDGEICIDTIEIENDPEYYPVLTSNFTSGEESIKNTYTKKFYPYAEGLQNYSYKPVEKPEINISLKQLNDYDLKYLYRTVYKLDTTMPFPLNNNKNTPYSQNESHSGFYLLERYLTKLLYNYEASINKEEIDRWKTFYTIPQIDVNRISDFPNLYTFLRNFNIPENTFKDYMKNNRRLSEKTVHGVYEYELTDNDIDILWSKDAEKIAGIFADEATIVKGQKFYSPEWIYYHTAEAYYAEGISPDELINKWENCYSHLYFTDEALNALEKKIHSYLAEYEAFEKDPNSRLKNTARQLLASIPEKGVSIYAYAMDAKTSINSNAVRGIPKELVGEIDIYLIAGDEMVWLREGYKARYQYHLFSRNLFNLDEYLLFVDYVHGGMSGGNTLMTVISGKEHTQIPMKQSFNIYEHKLREKDVLITLDDWEFEVPIDELNETFFGGNWFAIENGKLFEYFYYVVPDFGYVGPEERYMYSVCFKAEYVLRGGEITIGSLEIMDEPKYYPTFDSEAVENEQASPHDFMGVMPE
ncbi:MAG: hypothetical protein LBS21_13265 [Clostridiales bacterium]|nr:hypothetical protein [Clostridiales bacterium]